MRKTAFALVGCFGLMTAGLVISEHTNVGLLRTNAQLLELNARLEASDAELKKGDAELKRSDADLKAAADELSAANRRLRTACDAVVRNARELRERLPQGLGCATDKGCR